MASLRLLALRLPHRPLIPWSARQIRHSSSFEQLREELLARELPLLYDTPTLTQSHLLDATLVDFLPPFQASTFPKPGDLNLLSCPPLRQGHHIVYFPPPTRLSSLLPDATDPEQSPGEPFVRRMWAGGQIKFFPFHRQQLRPVSTLGVCLERISDVVVKGLPGEEKVFVTIERRFSGSYPNQFKYDNNVVKLEGTGWRDQISSKPPGEIRRSLLYDPNCSIIERRNLVFMRRRDLDAAKKSSTSASRIIKPPHPPEFSHTITPTPELLFRFSALTFNAHSIHLDKHYCREVEGHRNLLVHGPLSLVLMLEVLNGHLVSKDTVNRVQQTKAQRQIIEVEYRNIAPLYAEEEMKVCCRERGEGEWDIWVEGPNGGYAVKGLAKTREKPALGKPSDLEKPILEDASPAEKSLET